MSTRKPRNEIAKVEPAEKPTLPVHTQDWEDAYFAAFGNDVMEHAKTDPIFARKMLEGRAVLADMLRYEAIRRALVPVYRPVFQKGILQGYEELRDNRHLEWTLERVEPEEWNLARKLEVSGKGGGPVKFEFKMGEGEIDGDADEGEFDALDAGDG